MSIAAGSLNVSENAVGALSCFDEYDWQSDYDREVRKCNVSLWTRTIEGWSTTPDITRQHWALVFMWEDRIATYEANDTHGYLLPRWFDGKPKVQVWDEKTVKHIGTCLISPQKVNTSAKSCRLNGKKYVLGYVNCQQWVSILAKDLELEFNVMTLAEADPIAAGAATTIATMDSNKGAIAIGAGVGLFGALLYSLMGRTEEPNSDDDS